MCTYGEKEEEKLPSFRFSPGAGRHPADELTHPHAGLQGVVLVCAHLPGGLGPEIQPRAQVAPLTNRAGL